MKKYNKSDQEIKPFEMCSTEEDEDGFSERDFMLALSYLDEEFTEEEFKTEAIQIVVNKNLNSLISKGLVDPVWNEELNDFTFFAKEDISKHI